MPDNLAAKGNRCTGPVGIDTATRPPV